MPRFDILENRLASCVWNAWEDGQRETHCANPEDKTAARQLERRGLAKVRRTNDRCGDYLEWWVKFTPVGAEAYSAARAARAQRAIGRLLKVASRPFQPGDHEEYDRCRAAVLAGT